MVTRTVYTVYTVRVIIIEQLKYVQIHSKSLNNTLFHISSMNKHHFKPFQTVSMHVSKWWHEPCTQCTGCTRYGCSVKKSRTVIGLLKSTQIHSKSYNIIIQWRLNTNSRHFEPFSWMLANRSNRRTRCTSEKWPKSRKSAYSLSYRKFTQKSIETTPSTPKHTVLYLSVIFYLTQKKFVKGSRHPYYFFIFF